MADEILENPVQSRAVEPSKVPQPQRGLRLSAQGCRTRLPWEWFRANTSVIR
jgi:3-methyladenine DNA glycosylase AlkC